ncbi:MAG: alkaline phosphatase family protein [Planctomycetes bacterium]|nr:alkaline phosphatase family protein [Planctomycetota bacterium]MCB9935932.1 alkaline phosphatase family protein [Planctomycetota bacterium]
MRPLVIINVVGLTPRLIRLAPRLGKLAARPMAGVFPAVTMTAQASMLTGLPPSGHGVVGNSWYWRSLGEVRNWVQSNALLQGEPLYRAAKRRDAAFTCAKMFWWFNQGSGCDWSCTPKPHYGSDGSKEFDILTEPPELAAELKASLGDFPFASFWGPMAGRPSSDWIARATARVMRDKRPTLTLCYLPHLDYDLQRFGAKADVERLVREVDACAARVLDAADETGAQVLVVSEYGITPVSRPVYINRELRKAGMLRVRKGPFGEMLDVHESRAFAVCDHQAAHVYVREAADVEAVRALVAALPGVGRAAVGAELAGLGIAHAKAGDVVLLSERGAWFAYPYWLDDANAPDFARSVDIHRKPGYDPCELFLAGGRLGLGLTLLRKKLGFRYRFKSCPLDASIVKGSHGLPAADPEDGPIVAGRELPEAASMMEVKDLALRMMFG